MQDPNLSQTQECSITRVKVVKGNEAHKYYLCVFLSTLNNAKYKVCIENLIVGDGNESIQLHFPGGSSRAVTIIGEDSRKKEYNIDLAIGEQELSVIQKGQKIRISIGVYEGRMDTYIFPVSIEL